MRNGPSTKQVVTLVGLGAGTLIVALAVPIALFVRDQDRAMSGFTGFIGMLLLVFGTLLLTFTLPRFLAPGVAVYRPGALERSTHDLTTGSVNDGEYVASRRSEWRGFVIAGLVLWIGGVALSFFV